jgi:flagellar basal body-associated protein FliL
MPSPENSSETNPDSFRLAIVKIALTQIAVLLALAGAFIFYVNWSSQAALADFLDATELSLPAPEHHAQFSVPVDAARGLKACFLRA